MRTRGIRQARAASFVFALLATECWVLLFLMAGGMYSAAAALFAVPATVALRAKLKATLEDRGSEGEGRRTERAILNLTTGPSFFGIADGKSAAPVRLGCCCCAAFRPGVHPLCVSFGLAVGESRRRSGVSFDVSEGDEEAAAFADSPAALLAGDARRSADSTDRSLSQCALRGLLRWADGVSFFFVCGLLLLTTLEVKGGQFLVVAAPFLSACCCAFCWSSAVASRVVSKLNRQLSAKDRAQGLALFAPLHQRLLFSAPMDSCDTAAPLSSQLSSNSFDDALPLPVQLPPGEAFLEQAHFHNPQQTSDRCAFGNIHLGGNGGGLRTHFPREAVGFSDGQKASFFSNSPPEEPSPSSAAASGASARRGPNAKRTADWRVDGEEENKGQRNTSGCSQDSQDSARMQRREGRGNGDCFSNRHVSPASSEEERRSREEERGKREEKHHRQDRLAGHPEGRGTPENPSLDDSPYTRM